MSHCKACGAQIYQDLGVPKSIIVCDYCGTQNNIYYAQENENLARNPNFQHRNINLFAKSRVGYEECKLKIERYINNTSWEHKKEYNNTELVLRYYPLIRYETKYDAKFSYYAPKNNISNKNIQFNGIDIIDNELTRAGYVFCRDSIGGDFLGDICIAALPLRSNDRFIPFLCDCSIQIPELSLTPSLMNVSCVVTEERYMNVDYKKMFDEIGYRHLEFHVQFSFPLPKGARNIESSFNYEILKSYPFYYPLWEYGITAGTENFSVFLDAIDGRILSCFAKAESQQEANRSLDSASILSLGSIAMDSRNNMSPAELALRSAARSAGTTIAKKILRGVLSGLGK